MPSADGVAWNKRWVTPEVVISVLLVALLVVCAFTFNRYGFTTDENNGFIRARNISNYFASGGAETAALTEIKPENFYGAMADVLALWLQQLVPPLGFDARHLVSALFGVAGIYYAYRMGEHLGGRWTGVAAAGFLTLTPMWFGYMFINLKDIPFGAALIASSFYGVKVMGEAARPRWTTMLGLALWCGALGTTKLTGILLLGVAVLVLLVFFMLERGWLSPKVLAQRALICAGLGIAGIIAFAVPFWPQLYLYPPAQVIVAVLKFLNYDGWHNTVQINGQYFNWDQVPRYYLVTYLLITMPILPMVLFVAAIPSAIISKRYAVLGAIVLPVLYVAIQWVTEAQVYGGYRQFLFTVPFICIGAGYGLVSLARLGGRIPKVAALGGFAVFAVWSIVNMATLFPLQYSSYNLLVGGAPGAEGRYYVDVWRAAEREALQLIYDAMPAGMDGVRVYACGSTINFVPFPRLKPVTRLEEGADFYVWLPRCASSIPSGVDVLGEVRRQGVLFAAILRPTAGAVGQVPPHPDEPRQ